MIIQKVDDRDGNTPLEGVGFTITAEIKVWEYEGTYYPSCGHPDGVDEMVIQHMNIHLIGIKNIINLLRQCI